MEQGWKTYSRVATWYDSVTHWQKPVLLNIAGLVGVVVSLFIVPGETPFWLWCVIAIVVIAALNTILYVGRRRVADSARTARTAIVIVGVMLLMIDVIVSRYFR
jgi:hypothetical protein